MKHLLLLITFIIYCNSLQGQPLYVFDINEPATYSYNCGTTNSAFWGVKNDSCSLVTSTTFIDPSCGTSNLPINVKINQTGQLSCSDTALLEYTIDDGANWMPLDTIVGCEQTANTSYWYYPEIQANSYFKLKVTFDNNSVSDWWQIKNGDISILEPCLLLSIKDNQCSTEEVEFELPSLHYRSSAETRVPIKFYNMTGESVDDRLMRDLIEFDHQFQQIETLFFPEIIELDVARFSAFSSKDEAALIETKYDPNVINVYIANTIENNGSSISAYAHMPGGPKAVIISRHALGNKSTLAHEIGHVLGLYHTHRGSVNDTEDCEVTGDRVCDTPIDPGLTGMVENCTFTGTGFDPLIDNIMSYAPSNCRTSFTVGQIERMMQGIQYQSFRVTEDYVGQLEKKEAEITIWPNPTSDFINIMQPTEWSLFTDSGMIISSGSGSRIDMTELTQGIYFLHINNQIEKIVKF